jgi:hypothetical protein
MMHTTMMLSGNYLASIGMLQVGRSQCKMRKDNFASDQYLGNTLVPVGYTQVAAINFESTKSSADMFAVRAPNDLVLKS